MAGEGGKRLGAITITVEVYETGAPVVWIGRRLSRSREHEPLPQPLIRLLEEYALKVVER
jgi:c-di-GMP-binding flagellar brake protein YcgR